MSNFEKANKLARKWIDSMGGLSNINHIYGDDLSLLIYTLRDAGLLMPDLPEPGNNHSPSWGVVHLDKKKQVIKIGINGVLARTPKVAREWAYGLLAAADYAEKEQGNE